MPAVPSSFVEPLWVQFETLIPPVIDTHPLGCHNPRIADRVVFDKLVAKLVFGGSYVKHADATCSATTMRTVVMRGSPPGCSRPWNRPCWTPTTRSWASTSVT